MAGIAPLLQTSELKTNRLASVGSNKRIYEIHYDDLTDVLMILLVQPQEGMVTHYLDDHVGFLFEESSLEIVGLQIDAFEKAFLPANKSVQHVWLDIHSEEIKDFGRLTITMERIQPQVVKEVVKATRPILGPLGAKLAAFAGA